MQVKKIANSPYGAESSVSSSISQKPASTSSSLIFWLSSASCCSLSCSRPVSMLYTTWRKNKQCGKDWHGNDFHWKPTNWISLMPGSPVCVLSTLTVWPHSHVHGPAVRLAAAGAAARSLARSAARYARTPPPPSQHRSSSPAALKAATPPPGFLSDWSRNVWFLDLKPNVFSKHKGLGATFL